MSQDKKVTIGLVQMRCVTDPAENLANAVEKIKALAGQGAQIICLPELFRSLYFCQEEDPKFFELAEPIPGKTTELLARLAAEKKIVIVASLYEKSGEDYFNTAVVLDADGSLKGKYRKLHIPDDLKNYYGEAYYFKPGDLGTPVFETAYGKIGVLVCWDQWFPEAARSLAAQGATIIFYPTAIGYILDNKEANQKEREGWQTIQRSHAIANGVFVAAVNRVGRESHIDFWGTSFVAGPFGEVLELANDKDEKLLKVTCDLSEIERVRKDWPFLEARRKDL
ncbi:MAG: carbon-nitrogen hydrolase [bacterium]|nr:carbon-nitrogen hydrolase [bacterium]